ncbi:MAG: hypothetical protein M1831_002854 [Alyxoria varia]|nr:MAG: hypothetical protein M1831_002854 [Alyxoria varia]
MPKPTVNTSKEYTSMKAIKKLLGFSEGQMRTLVARAREFISENEDDCAKVPRIFKGNHWYNLTRQFVEDEGAGDEFVGENREGCLSGNSLVWPDDEDQVLFAMFCLIKLESSKHTTKKRTSELMERYKTGQPVKKPRLEYIGKKEQKSQGSQEVQEDDEDNDNSDQVMDDGEDEDEEEVTGDLIQGQKIYNNDPFKAARAATVGDLVPVGHGPGALEQQRRAQLKAKHSGHKYGSFSMGLSPSNGNSVGYAPSASGQSGRRKNGKATQTTNTPNAQPHQTSLRGQPSNAFSKDTGNPVRHASSVLGAFSSSDEPVYHTSSSSLYEGPQGDDSSRSMPTLISPLPVTTAPAPKPLNQTTSMTSASCSPTDQASSSQYPPRRLPGLTYPNPVPDMPPLNDPNLADPPTLRSQANHSCFSGFEPLTVPPPTARGHSIEDSNTRPQEICEIPIRQTLNNSPMYTGAALPGIHTNTAQAYGPPSTHTSTGTARRSIAPAPAHGYGLSSYHMSPGTSVLRNAPNPPPIYRPSPHFSLTGPSAPDWGGSSNTTRTTAEPAASPLDPFVAHQSRLATPEALRNPRTPSFRAMSSSDLHFASGSTSASAEQTQATNTYPTYPPVVSPIDDTRTSPVPTSQTIDPSELHFPPDSTSTGPAPSLGTANPSTTRSTSISGTRDPTPTLTFNIRVSDPRFRPMSQTHMHTATILRPSTTDFRGLFGSTMMGLNAEGRAVLANARRCSVADSADGRYEFGIYDPDAERVWRLLMKKFVGKGEGVVHVGFE